MRRLQKIYRSIKTKARLGVTTVVFVLGAFGLYLYHSGNEIRTYSSQMQGKTYPSLVKAKDLYNSIEKLKNKFALAVMDEDEDALAEAVAFGDICISKLQLIRDSNPDPVLDTMQVDLINYIQSVQLVVKQVIKGKEINYDVIATVGDLFHDLERFKESEEANLKKGFDNIRIKSYENFKTSLYIFSIILLTLYLFFSFILKILADLGDLSAQTKQIADGKFDTFLPRNRSDELGLLQNNFDKMRQNVGDLIRNLDTKVKKRTSDISNIMDNIKIGLISLDEDLRIKENYSGYTEQLLGITNLAGKSFPEILYPYEPEKAEDIKLILSKLLEGVASKDLLQDAMPDSPIPWKKGPSGKGTADYIKLDFEKISKHESGKANIMLSLSDVSQEIELQKRLQKNRTEFEENKALVGILMESGRDSFSEYVKKHITHLKEVQEELKNSNSSPPKTTGELMRIFHTLKGDSLVYNLTNISSKAHNLEYLLEEISMEQRPLVKNEKAHISEQIGILLKEIRNIARKVNRVFGEDDLGNARELERELSYTLPADDVNNIIELLKKESWNGDQTKVDFMLNKLQELKYVPLEKLWSRIPGIVKNLSERLDKQMNPVEFKGGDILITHEFLNKISDCLLHMVRNALDHGIEPGPEREELGKRIKGTLALKAEKSKGQLMISVQDDGSGIDWETIHQRVIEKNIMDWTQLNKLVDSEKKNLIFHPGISNREENQISEISGRGVGMDVVKSIVDELRGAITFSSKLNEGTLFTLSFPKESYTLATSENKIA